MDVGLGLSGPSAASSAGGGNVFNDAPLFGSLFGQYGASNGDNGAAASATSAASGKGVVPISGGNANLPASTGSTAASSAICNYLPFLLIGAAGLVIVFGGLELFKILKK